MSELARQQMEAGAECLLKAKNLDKDINGKSLELKKLINRMETSKSNAFTSYMININVVIDACDIAGEDYVMHTTPLE